MPALENVVDPSLEDVGPFSHYLFYEEFPNDPITVQYL